MKIITDLRVLNTIAKKNKITIDKKYKYITTPTYYIPNVLTYNGKIYKAKYFDGCFNPYIVEI